MGRCSWSNFRPWTRHATTLSCSGIRLSRRRPAMGCFTCIGCFGARRCPRFRRWRSQMATRTVLGGVIRQKPLDIAWRLVVVFVGGELARLAPNAEAKAVVSVVVESLSASPLSAGSCKGYRAMLGLKPSDDSIQPIDMRMFFKSGTRTLTETWMYRWTPLSHYRLQAQNVLALAGVTE